MTRVTVHPAGEGLEGPVEAILEAHPVEWRGCRVLLKPNCLGLFPPERGVTTSPELVRTAAAALARRGAAEILMGDNPGVEGYARSGTDAVRQILGEIPGVRMVSFGETVARRVEGARMPLVPIAREVLEADRILNLPRAKTHMFTLLTGAVKNCFGYVGGGAKATLHARLPTNEAFSPFLVELYCLRPPDLTILDALTVMEGNGPSAGELRPYGRLVASRDAVAVDEVLARIMGIEPARVPQIASAWNRGLGSAGGALEVEGEAPPIPRFRVPDTHRFRLGVPWANRLLFPLLNPAPRIRRDACIACGVCWRHCPVEAIAEGAPPRVDEGACIRCYCCVELCPEHAVGLQGTWLDRIRKLRSLLHPASTEDTKEKRIS